MATTQAVLPDPAAASLFPQATSFFLGKFALFIYFMLLV
jgi:hypothetical protein